MDESKAARVAEALGLGYDETGDGSEPDVWFYSGTVRYCLSDYAVNRIDALLESLSTVESIYAQVYCHITGGVISKVNTDPAAIIELFEECQRKEFEAEHAEEFAALLTERDTANKLVAGASKCLDERMEAINNLAKELFDTQNERDALSAELAALQAKYADLALDNGHEKTMRFEAVGKSKLLEVELAAARAEVERLRGQLDKWCKE